MFRDKLLLDTNVVIDFLGVRQPYYDEARLLMLTGKVGEFQLWMSTSQIADVIYILSEGGKKGLMPKVLASVGGLLDFVSLYCVDGQDIDAMLKAGWADAEDALLHQVALRVKASALITRNKADFEKSLIPVMSCAEFFEDLQDKRGVSYSEVAF